MSDNDQTVWFENDLTCKPLSSLKDIQLFIYDPPAWRTLCQPITPHSTNVIRNSEVNPNFSDLSLEKPQSFCHFDPDRPSVARHDEKTLPKVLVCHDMANGYHDDSVIDGTSDYEAYTFYNWTAVDIFCYFSHHLITIPPLGWINVAHAHGVKVIGTFITEWAEGVALWKKIMSEPEGIENLVTWLVTITRTFKFEGWLINVENKISEPDKLLHFLGLLHKSLHDDIPGAELIWYDSVVRDGSLSWQNALNHLNRPFFDACDGIFTNYSWTKRNIEQSVLEAGSRLRDVYVGIDVWGRNFYGGGMFNTQEAVKLVHEFGCSLAIFAPAWTHEAMDDAEDESNPNHIIMGGDLMKHERFSLRDIALWGSLWPYLKTRLPCTLPFKTSFCRGLGNKRRMYGEVLCNGPWYNLRHMQYQPNSMLGAHRYLLSTNEKLTNSTRLAVKRIRYNKGILRLRESLMQFNTLMEEEEKERKVRIQLAPNDVNADNNLIEEDEVTEKKNEEIKNETAEVKTGSIEVKKEKAEGEKGTNKKTETTNEDKSDEVDEEEKNKFISQQCSITATKDESKISRMKIVFKKLFGLKKKNEGTREERTEERPEERPDVSSQTTTSKHDSTLQSPDQYEKSLPKRSAENKSKVDALDDVEEPKELAKRMSSLSGRSVTRTPVHFSLAYDKMRLTLAFVHEERNCLTHWFGDSFNGGTCLRVCPSDPVSEDHRTIRLFQCDFLVEGILVVCMVTKSMPGFYTQWLDMWIYVLMEGGAERRVQLAGRREEMPPSSTDGAVYPLDHASSDFRELQTYLVVHEPGFYVPIENSYGWHINYYQVPLGRSRVTSINLRTGHRDGSILLGHVGICARAFPQPST